MYFSHPHTFQHLHKPLHCKVYQKQSVSVDKAIGYDKRSVKVITTFNTEYEFDSIYYKNDKLYGLIPQHKEEVLLSETHLKEIYLVDNKKSKKMTILLCVGIPLSILITIVIIAATDSDGVNPLPDGI